MYRPIPITPAFGRRDMKIKSCRPPNMKVHTFNPALYQLVLVRISVAAKKHDDQKAN